MPEPHFDPVRIGIQLDRAEEAGLIETDVAATLRRLVEAEARERRKARYQEWWESFVDPVPDLGDCRARCPRCRVVRVGGGVCGSCGSADAEPVIFTREGWLRSCP